MKCLSFKNILNVCIGSFLLMLSAWANALEVKPYSANELAALQQMGKPVAVHFHADWCPTCVKQAASLETLKADPQLNNMTVLVASYDKEKDLRKSMNIPSQSIMVVYKGTMEVARVKGLTQSNHIKAEFAKGM